MARSNIGDDLFSGSMMMIICISKIQNGMPSKASGLIITQVECHKVDDTFVLESGSISWY